MSPGRQYVVRAAAVLAVLIVWEAVSRSGIVPIPLFPPPSSVFRSLVQDTRSGPVLGDALASVRRVAVGFAAGSLLGMALGMLTGLWETANLTLGQVLQLLRPLPPVSIVPLVILWIGVGEDAKWFLVAFGVLFPVWVSMHTGIRQVLPTYIWTAKSMGANGVALLGTVYLPAALPFLAAGLRTAMAIAFFCLVAAEATGASEGIMYRVGMSQNAYRADRTLEGLLLLGVLSALCDSALLFALRRVSPQAFLPGEHGLAHAD